MSDVMGITRLSHLCKVNMVIQYMHAGLGNHKTMTHQYTVNVIHVYRGLIVFTQHLLTSLESLFKDDQKCSLNIIQLSRLSLA